MAKVKKIVAADLFCGAGGTSSGLVRACHEMGIDVDLLAVNHWPTAIATHSANHPNAKHICARIDQIRPEDEIPGGRIHLLVASPECTHHSKARGGKPMNDQSRATAWDILNWVNRVYVDNILIENVTEFMDWGPLGANGRPLKSKRGETFRAFIAAFKRVGYNVEYKVLNAANYGDATTRERLFIIGRRKAQGKNSRIIWPEATHAPASKTAELFGDKQPWRSAREIIDWSLEGKSIFSRKNPLAAATLKRIEAGLRKFGGKSAEPFVVVLRQHMSAQSVDEPLPTITAGGQHIGVCEPFILGQQSGSTARSVEQPIPTVATDGAISLVEPFIVPQFGEAQPKSVDDPLGTITTTSRGIGLCEPFLVTTDRPETNRSQPRSVEEPLPTVTGTQRIGMVEPFLIVNRTNNTAKSLDEPVPTLCTGNHVGMVEPFLVNIDHTGSNGGQVMSTDRPLPTQTTKARTALVEPYLVRFQGNREKDLERNQTLDQPLGTLDTSNRYGVVEPFIVPFYGEREGQDPRVHSVEEPLPTVTGHGAGAIVQPYLVGYNGTSGPQSVDDPLATVTTRDRFGLVMPQIEIEGQRYYVDIRFRMLQPHELAAAMGFPEDYKFTGNKGDIVKQIGNAVPGHLSKALCQSLIAEAA